jgi:hypothetical protein
MRLVLQCSVCGTVHTVGTAICGTCLAAGIQNLRLLFECERCLRLGLNTSCDVCSHSLSLNPNEPTAKATHRTAAISPIEHSLDEELLEGIVEAELVGEPFPARDKKCPESGESDFEIALDDLGIPELDEEELRLDDGSDCSVKDA